MSQNNKTCLPLLRSHYQNLTKVEQRIADYILEQPSKVMNMTSSELADITDCGEATLFRLCHKLGFSGFQRLKQALSGDLFSPLHMVSQEVEPEDSPEIVTHKIFQNIVEALQETSKILDYKALEKAIQVLSKTQRIYAFGFGGSGVIAQDIEHRFMRFGITVRAYTDPHLQMAISALLTKEDVVIAISHTGASIDILKSLELAKENGATIIVITSHQKSPITKFSDIILAGLAKETSYRSEAMASRLVHLAIVDALYSGIILNRTEPYITNMEKVRDAIAKQKL